MDKRKHISVPGPQIIKLGNPNGFPHPQLSSHFLLLLMLSNTFCFLVFFSPTVCILHLHYWQLSTQTILLILACKILCCFFKSILSKTLSCFFLSPLLPPPHADLLCLVLGFFGPISFWTVDSQGN